MPKISRYGVACRHIWELTVLHCHKIMVIFMYSFLVVIIILLSWILFINDFICILNGSPRRCFLLLYMLFKNGGLQEFSNYLDATVNFHYNGKNRVITG